MKNNIDKEKPWKKKNQKKPMKKWVKILLISIASLLVLALVAVGFGAAFVFRSINKNPTQAEHEVNENVPNMFEKLQPDIGEPQPEVKPPVRKEGFYNILVIGRDKVALNTDVMIVASFDTVNKKAATVQIPRDSYVEDKNGKQSKINAVFARGYVEARTELNRLKSAAKNKSDEEIAALCSSSVIAITPEKLKANMSGKLASDDIYSAHGMKTLQDVISRTFGIYFDYYAIVSTDAFVKIVDAVGGVDVYVQHDMHYEDPYQDLYIHINKGNQHLDGKTAEGFVRFRAGYVQADIARLDAQKIFLTAFFKKLLSFSTVSKVDNIVRTVFDCVKTDMTLESALGFVKPALSMDLSQVVMMNMVGAPYNNGSYYSLNKAENLKIVNSHFNIFDKPLSENALHVVELIEQGELEKSAEGMTMEDINDSQPAISFLPPSVKQPELDESASEPTDLQDLTEQKQPGDAVEAFATTEQKQSGDTSAENADSPSSTAEPTSQEPTAQGSTTQESTTQEPTAQGSTTQESTTQELAAQESTSQESTTQESANNSSATEEKTTAEKAVSADESSPAEQA